MKVPVLAGVFKACRAGRCCSAAVCAITLLRCSIRSGASTPSLSRPRWGPSFWDVVSHRSERESSGHAPDLQPLNSAVGSGANGVFQTLLLAVPDVWLSPCPTLMLL